jgi:hypothetical protein
MLIAQAIVNNSEEVSLAVQGAWQNTWELAFNGTLYQALTNLGLLVAVASLLLWTIQFTKNLIDDQSYRQFGELIWPVIVIVLLTNGGQNLIGLTNGMRTVINNANNSVLGAITSTAQLEKTLSALADFSVTQEQIIAYRQQCNGLTKNEEMQVCLQEVNTKAQALLGNYQSNYGAVAAALVGKLQKQIQKASENPLEAVTNLFPGTVISIMLAAIETFMVAMQSAFQALIEVGFLLTGLLGPLAVGASLLPIGAKPLYAWMTGFWSLGMAKLSLNIVTGLAATAIAASAQMDTLSIAIVLGLLAPILALSLSAGGGMAIFSAILSAASAAASAGLNIGLRISR